MGFVLFLSQYIVPFLIFSILVTGILERVQVYETFIKGAKDGFYTVLKIMPTLIGLMVAVGVLRASGFLEFLSGLLGQWTQRIGAAFCRKDVFFVRSDRASDRSLQRVWHRFLYRAHRIHLNGMYRDNFLHDVCLFYDSKSQEIQIHAGRGVACYSGRTCS